MATSLHGQNLFRIKIKFQNAGGVLKCQAIKTAAVGFAAIKNL